MTPRVPRLRWTLRRKLLAMQAAGGLLVVLVLAFWAWWDIAGHTADARAHLDLASHQAAAQVEAMLGELTAHLSSHARTSPPPGAMREPQWFRLLEMLSVEHPEIENVLVVGPDGRVIVSVRPSPGAVSLADRPWFKRVITTGRTTVSDFQTGRIVPEPIVVVAVPRVDAGGAAIGALAAAVNLRRLYRVFDSLPLPSGMTVTILDGQGRVLSNHPPSAAEIPGRPFAALGAGTEGITWIGGQAWADGVERLAGVAPVAGTGWRVIAALPRAAVERDVYRSLRTLGVPLLIILSVSSALAFLVARRVSRPLEALTAAVRRLQQGEAVSVQVTSSDEVGDLARAFNAMAADLQESRRRLERRVADLSVLSEAGRLLTRSLDLATVLQHLAALARRHLGVDVVRIWLRDEATGALVLRAQEGVTRQEVDQRARFGAGASLAGWIMAHRSPLVVPQVLADPRLENRAWVEAEGIVAFLGVPLLLENEPVGVLACLSRTPREFTADDVALARLLSDPAAVAIRNAALHEETRRRAQELAALNRRMETLHSAARALAGLGDLTPTLQGLLDTAREVVGASYGALALVSGEGRIREFLTTGLPEEARERMGGPPEGRGLLGEILRHGKPLRLDDIRAHPASVGLPPGLPHMRSLLGVPLRFRDRTVGALLLAEKPRGFASEDEALLTTLGADAAAMIENSRLVHDLRRALDDLHAAQEQLVQDEALRAVGGLASGMAHHLNNLLTVISARVQLLLRQAGEPLREPLEKVGRAAAEAAEVLRRLQEFSRAQRAPSMALQDMNRIARQALDVTRPHREDVAARRGISIDAGLEPGRVPPISGDAVALREALASLVSNAIDAMPGGGRIMLRTWAEGEQVCCSVTDSGEGMTEEVRQRAMEPFFTTRGPKSHGLGLSLAYGVVRRHGGRLTIDSAPGRGTTVTIALPAAAAEPAPPAPEPAATPRSTTTILVIEPDPDVREMLRDFLGGLGYLVRVAADGAEGVAAFQAEPAAVVVADTALAGRSAREVVRAIKVLGPGTPVVLLAGWEAGMPDRGVTGADRVVGMPLDPAAIAAAVEDLLGRRGGAASPPGPV